jgi:hypothetical protein
MPSIDKNTLLAAICPPLDQRLADQMVDEFVSLERRYVLRDWEPATLDGGQFAEASARLLYHQDSGTLNRRKGVNECLTYVEDPNNSNRHAFPERKAALHIDRVIRTIYKLRSDRGAVHIDPDYTANHLDSKLVLENCRWIISEFLRVFWTADRREVAAAIRQIIQYDVPVIGVYDGRPLVQRVDCSPEEEILILLHHAGEEGLSRTGIGRAVPRGAPTVTRALTALVSRRRREIVKLQNRNYRLTDIGIRRVLTELADKLVI